MPNDLILKVASLYTRKFSFLGLNFIFNIIVFQESLEKYLIYILNSLVLGRRYFLGSIQTLQNT